MINTSSVHGLRASPFKGGVHLGQARSGDFRRSWLWREAHMAWPEEVAEVAAFLCTSEASFINSASLRMDDGATATW